MFNIIKAEVERLKQENEQLKSDKKDLVEVLETLYLVGDDGLSKAEKQSLERYIQRMKEDKQDG